MASDGRVVNRCFEGPRPTISPNSRRRPHPQGVQCLRPPAEAQASRVGRKPTRMEGLGVRGAGDGFGRCSDKGSGGDGSTEPTSEAPSRSAALTRCDPRTSSCGSSVVGAADQSAPSSPTRRWTVRATATYLNTTRVRDHTFLTKPLIPKRASLGRHTSWRGGAHVNRPLMSGPHRGHRQLKQECRRPSESIQGGVATLRALFGPDDATATKVAPRPCTGAGAKPLWERPALNEQTPCG